MIIFYFFLVILLIIPLPRFGKGGVFKDYIDPKETLCIKGIFVILVMLSHFKGYITLSDNFADQMFATINGYIGQLMVTLFFFYSGYGIYESVKAKGRNYVVYFPKKRVLITWLSFAICVTLFLIEGYLLGNSFEPKTILLSYLGWDTLGNSNWFMFVTFGMYVMFFLAFIFDGNTTSIKSLLLFTILTLLFTAFLYLTKESWWWNTAFCFPLGMWFSRYRNFIDEFCRTKKYGWIVLLMISGIGFLVSYYVSMKYSGVIFLIAACFFCLFVVVLSMKVKIRNSVLAFLGKHVFSIYMLQRLWYIPLSTVEMNRYLFLAISVVLTISSAVLFDYVMDKIRTRLLVSV